MGIASRRIAVLGAGQIGSVIAGMLTEQGHRVTLADASPAQLALSAEQASGGDALPALATKVVDAGDLSALRSFLDHQEVVVSACPFFLNKGIACTTAQTRTHYFDLTEDVATTLYIRELADAADIALIPQCGLAPGFVCVLGADMATRFDTPKTIKMRVGALPLCPTNILRYNVTWSVDGLINEYCNPCEIVDEGKLTLVPALDGVESVMIDGVAYEAFNTSGGLGTLAETLAGSVRELSYKTLRYPGHADIIKLLLHGLGLSDDKETMRRILNRAAPFTHKDVVVIFVTGVGERRGRMEEDSIVLRYDGRRQLGAIQLTTAAGCVAMVELFLAGKLPARGFIRQEDARLPDFLATNAGRRLAREARNSETPAIAEMLSSDDPRDRSELY